MNEITIIGLGPSNLDQMPLNVYRLLKETDKKLFARTKLHPAVEELENEGVHFHFYDSFYEAEEKDFDKVYQAIVEDLLERTKTEDIVYAVPGHPMVAEKTVQLLLSQPNDVKVNILGGKSFLDDLFQAVKKDPIDGFQLLDSFDLNPDEINSSQQIVIMQVFNDYIASEVKLSLMEIYPDDFLVALVNEAGGKKETVRWIPLYELDRLEGIYNLLSLYIPPLPMEKRTKSFSMLQDNMDKITGENGDAWIRQQSHTSLVPYLLEETQEFKEAVESEDIENMIEELGDILMQVLYHASIGEKTGYFFMEDIIETLNNKLKRRHPHVFDGITATTPEEVDKLWQEIKRKERKEKQ
ncbi:MazG nucleotide pyrophosphohydrolase domain-containing protein [Lacticigenium naphthae]|uniref:MazG nucleotide pyrophosphohydrolase domain-containing protein n=1 Tax=Lacticigenium naphthae TaxID=515351 RepID=UPI00040E7D5E|nr:MazG nucleotide pyrophosphohydrolase domain-containing protein [Lacticigenium naphthae]